MPQSLQAEWHRFRADSPGERFYNHYERARKASRIKRLVQLIAGVFLIGAGIVLCFIPGPGLPVMVLGLALLSSQSRAVARMLDRLEPPVRRFTRRVKQRWTRST